MIHGGRHLKIYDEFIGNKMGRSGRVCEILGTPGADVAHIEPSGMGGRDSAHTIENLMALHPVLHTWTEGRMKEWLTENHKIFMETGVCLSERDMGDKTLREFLSENYSKLNKRWGF